MHNVAFPISPRRLRAVAILRFGSVDALHKRMPVGPRAVAYQLARGILSEPVRDALIGQIGADGFRFICGEVHTLDDSPPIEPQTSPPNSGSHV